VTFPSSSPKKRWGSVLHSIFAVPGQSEQPRVVIRSFGNENWYESIKPAEIEVEQEEPKAIEHKARGRSILLKRDATSMRRMPWLRPSQSVIPTVVDLAIQWSDDNSSTAVIGKLVHRWFEEIPGWIKDYKPSKKRLKEIASSTLTQEEMGQVKLSDWIDRFVKYCEMPSVLLALSADRFRPWHQPRMLHLEVTNEPRFLQIVDGQMLRGVIDRCVLGFDGDRVVRAEILHF
jgi:hypothetical protein